MSNTKIEKRFEVRAAGKTFSLEGNALKYEEISSNELAPGIRERIKRGAFAASIASGRDVKCYLNHDGKQIPLGRMANCTLELNDNSDFLSFRCKLTRGIQAHEDCYAAVEAGLITECSFAFMPDDEDMTDETYNGEQCMVRNIKRAKLFDVSVVGEPFYGGGATSVSARNADEAWRAEMRKRLDAAMQPPVPTTEELKAKAARLAAQLTK